MTTLAPERTDLAPTKDIREGDPLEAGDHERMSHYVTKQSQEAAWMTGEPCVALCGKVWLPQRDGQKFPLCPECEELFEMGPEGRMDFFKKRAESGD